MDLGAMGIVAGMSPDILTTPVAKLPRRRRWYAPPPRGSGLHSLGKGKTSDRVSRGTANLARRAPLPGACLAG